LIVENVNYFQILIKNLNNRELKSKIVEYWEQLSKEENLNYFFPEAFK
jgi:preprotein translocase subunit SecA